MKCLSNFHFRFSGPSQGTDCMPRSMLYICMCDRDINT